MRNKIIETINIIRGKTQPIIRNAIQGRYMFVSLTDLMDMTRQWVRQWDKQYDVIVGIPRSGLLVANAVGMMLGKPVATPDMMVNNIRPFYRSGREVKTDRVILIDDSVSSGETMRKNSNMLSRYGINHDRGALFVKPDSKQEVDIYYMETGDRRIFEWNMMHAKNCSVGFDMDGVLCEECPQHVKKSPESYADWVLNARPYLIPSYTIDVIISNRLEMFRNETEQWLDDHGVQYKKLVLWDVGWDERRGYDKNKARNVLKYHPELFFESSWKQAQCIWYETGIPTICIEKMVMLK